MEPVYFKSLKEDHFVYDRPLIESGVMIRLKWFKNKRFFGEIMGISKDQPYTHTLTIALRYKPSPKSRLKAKGRFSKIKYRILN